MSRKIRALLLIPLVFSVLFLMCRFASTYDPIQPAALEERVPILFVYRDDNAGAVCVAGDFNSWSGQSDCMSRSGDVWSVVVSLPPGRYSYLFIVDDRDWREDPGCALAEDSGFGTKNSVLIVE
jgi:1,4-alpha-glucan branching enzyme